MARKLKWIVGIGVGLMVITVIVAYALLSRYDYNALKPQISRAAKEATGRELHIGGDIHIEIKLSPAIVLTDIRFQNASWGSRPELARIGRVEVEVALLPLLSGRIVVKRLILVEPDLLIETNRERKTNLLFEKPGKEEQKAAQEFPKKVPALPALSFSRLTVEKGRLAYRDGRSGTLYPMDVNRLNAISAGTETPVHIVVNGDFRKEPFDVRGTLGSLTALLDPQKTCTVDLSARTLGATASLKGSIKDLLSGSGMDLRFAFQAADLKRLWVFTGKRFPLAGPLDVSGRTTDTAKGVYRISDLTLSLGDNRVSGSMEADLSKGPPRISAMIQTERLDLRPLLSKEGKRPGAEEPLVQRKSGKVFSPAPLPLDAIRSAEGTVKIRADKLLLPGIGIHNLFAEVACRGREWSVRPLTALIGGGMVSAEVELEVGKESATLSAQVKADAVDLGSMLREVGIADLSGGRLNVDIDIRGHGNSVAGLMAGLDGHSVLISEGARIKNKHLDLLGADISAGLFRLLNPFKEKSDYTDLNCAVVRFDIQKGLAGGTVLVMDTEHTTVVGDGRIDLKTEKLDISLIPHPKEAVGDTGVGTLSLSLGELAKPFRLAGTLAEPSLALDPAQAALTIGKAAAGTLVFGPVGIAAALIDARKGDKNPCLAAIEVARKGARTKGLMPQEEKGVAQKTTEAVEGAVKGVGKRLKGLFNQKPGRPPEEGVRPLP